MQNTKPIRNKKLNIVIDNSKKLNRKFHNNDVVEQLYKKGDYKKEDIQKYVNKLSKELKKSGFKGSISGWRSGYFTNVGENPALYTLADSDFQEGNNGKIRQFSVYLIKDYVRPTAGGCSYNSNYNDCLYFCLLQALEILD